MYIPATRKMLTANQNKLDASLIPELGYTRISPNREGDTIVRQPANKQVYVKAWLRGGTFGRASCCGNPQRRGESGTMPAIMSDLASDLLFVCNILTPFQVLHFFPFAKKNQDYPMIFQFCDPDSSILHSNAYWIVTTDLAMIPLAHPVVAQRRCCTLLPPK